MRSDKELVDEKDVVDHIHIIKIFNDDKITAQSIFVSLFTHSIIP